MNGQLVKNISVFLTHTYCFTLEDTDTSSGVILITITIAKKKIVNYPFTTNQTSMTTVIFVLTRHKRITGTPMEYAKGFTREELR